MNRRAFVTGLGAVLAAPRAAEAQRPDRMSRVAIIQTISTPAGAAAWQLTKDRLRELGYTEGRNVIVIQRSADGDMQMLPAIAAEVVKGKPDVILAGTPPAAAAVVEATKTIPIVAVIAGDPVAKGWAKSLARPGGNVTGITDLVAEEIVGKRFELLKQIIPGLTQVGWLWWPEGGLYGGLPPVAEPARRLGLTVRIFEFRSRDDITASFSTAKKAGVEALVVQGDALVAENVDLIVGQALKYRIPCVSASKTFAEAGGLLGYGVDVGDAFRHAADYVDRILKGTAPADLPIQRASKFLLVINLKTANALGLTIPPSLLLRADQVLE